jgi:hypothetical protein
VTHSTSPGPSDSQLHRILRIGFRGVFSLWVIIGVLGGAMSALVLDFVGTVIFLLFACVGVAGLLGTRKPMSEWRITKALALPPGYKGRNAAATAKPTSVDAERGADQELPRPNNSLERTREG